MKPTRKQIWEFKKELETNLKGAREKKGNDVFPAIANISRASKKFLFSFPDLQILLDGIIESCESKDRERCQTYIDHFNKQIKTKSLEPVRVAMQSAFTIAGKIHRTDPEKIASAFKVR